jgi:2-amino-4-hydroxy-6-hydroxymethyldihydropteridine diphosphokinase
MREVILLIGSNIAPLENITRVMAILKSSYTVNRYSSVWETEPYRTVGENFLNLAVSIQTALPEEDLRYQLREIESSLGRVRTADKYAPRTMDIDIILDNGVVHDDKLWLYDFVGVPISQLVPDFAQPVSGTPLSQIASRMKASTLIKERTDISIG